MTQQIALPPIKETTEDFERLEKEIMDLFKREIYRPLIPMIATLSISAKQITTPSSKPSRNSLTKAELLLNSSYQKTILSLKTSKLLNVKKPNDLAWNLQKGTIQYNRGVFTGKFNATTSRQLKELGAKWDRKTSSWKLTKDKIPYDVRSAISMGEVEFERKVKKIDERLAQILPEEIAGSLKIEKLLDRTLWKVDKEFHKNVKGLVVAPQLTDSARERIAEEWTENMKKYIKDFTQKEIEELRGRVKDTVYAGNRRESLIGTIQRSYGVSERKAKFLARQETGLLMAKFKETRYADAGVKQYKWGCVSGTKNHPVRPWHKALEGKIFKWEHPPVTTKPGEAVRRNNPGEDYNCRCFAIPIVSFKKGK